MASSDRLRQQAEYLFALALRARAQGDVQLAEDLTARALKYLDEANGTHGEDIPPEPPPSVPQVQQQPQAQQSGDDEKEKD